jgi:hypothetical protein
MVVMGFAPGATTFELRLKPGVQQVDLDDLLRLPVPLLRDIGLAGVRLRRAGVAGARLARGFPI